MPVPRLAFLLVEGLLLAVAAAVGGPFWTLPLAVAATGVGFVDLRATAIAALLPAFGWLAASHLTGDRELFFPYCMHLAGQVAATGWAPSRGDGGRADAGTGRIGGRAMGVLGAIAVVATFLGIRVAQRATPRVLLVEAAAAAAILVATAVTLRVRAGVRAESGFPGLVVAAGAALLAYAALGL